jgi:hypothetical protein
MSTSLHSCGGKCPREPNMLLISRSSAAFETPQPKPASTLSAPTINLTPAFSTITFELFPQLPAKLQVQVIKHAWINVNRDIKVICEYNFQIFQKESYYSYTIAANLKLPPLYLVNRLFLSDCCFLDRPYLITIPSNGMVPFLPNIDALQLDTP